MQCIFGFHYNGKYYVHFSKENDPDLRIRLLQDLQTADLEAWTESLKKIKVTPINQTSRFSAFENLDWSKPSVDLVKELSKSFPESFSALLDSGHVVNCVDDEGKPQYDDYSFIVDLDTNTFDYYEDGELKKQVPIKKRDLEKLCKEWEDALKNDESD